MTRWQIVFWMFVVAAVSYLDRNNISIAAVAIQKEYGIGDQQLGWVFSAFGVGYAFTQPFAGRIADRFGPFRVIAIGIVWWSVFTSLTAMVPPGLSLSLVLLMMVRFVLGIGEAVIFPASNRLVANWLPHKERGLANGIIFSGVGIGAGVAPPLITWIIASHGWHWAFYISAAIGLIVLAAWLAFVRDTPDQSSRTNERERALIRAGDAVSTTAVPVRWRDIVRNRTVALLAASYFTYGYVAWIFFTWFFKYTSVVRGLDLKASALYATLPFLAMAIASPLGGWIGDVLAPRLGERRARCVTAAAAMGLAALFVALATQVADARLAVVFLAGGAGALYLSQSAFWTLSANIGGASSGSVSGFMNMANQIGGILTASLTPYLANHYGWTISFVFAAVLCAIGALLWLLIDPNERLAAVPA